MNTSPFYPFSPEEQAMYARQALYPQFTLFAARDALDVYSNHSQQHVTEVMEQCEALFQTLWPWLRPQLPHADMDDLLSHLLVAAKYHDVRMGGTDAEMALLYQIDALYGITRLQSSAIDASALRQHAQRLRALSAEAAWQCDALSRALALCRSAQLNPAGVALLGTLLAQSHDQLKDGIRRRHGPQGALYVLSHGDAIRARYGAGLDLPLIAAMIDLHSTSSTPIRSIGIGADERARLTGECVRAILWEAGCSMPADPDWLRTAVLLGTILRLADTRRSGTRMSGISGMRLHLVLEEDGQPGVFYSHGGERTQVLNEISVGTLFSEGCTEFLPVTLAGDAQCRTLSHTLLARRMLSAQAWQYFVCYRLCSYLEELESACLRQSPALIHRVTVRLVDTPAELLPGFHEALCRMAEEQPLLGRYVTAICIEPGCIESGCIEPGKRIPE